MDTYRKNNYSIELCCMVGYRPRPTCRDVIWYYKPNFFAIDWIRQSRPKRERHSYLVFYRQAFCFSSAGRANSIACQKLSVCPFVCFRLLTKIPTFPANFRRTSWTFLPNNIPTDIPSAQFLHGKFSWTNHPDIFPRKIISGQFTRCQLSVETEWAAACSMPF